MNIGNMNDLFLTLERIVKAGLIHTVVRTENELADAVENEIIVSYSYDPNAPVLKVVKNGKAEFLYTESDALFREFKEKILQVGTDPTTNSYNPSIYFKLVDGTNNNPGFDKDTITEFYNQFKDNANIKPFIHHVKNKDGEFQLTPFTEGNHIYIDISEIFGGEQDVKTVNEVFVEFWNKLVAFKDELKKSIDVLKANIDKAVEDFKAVDAEQSKLLDTLSKTNDSNLEAIKDLHATFDNLLANVEYGIRPVRLVVSHSGGNMVVPVLITVSGGREVSGALKELFEAPVYIVDELGNQFAKIGSDLMSEGGTFTDSSKALDWITRRTGDVTTIYECQQVGTNQFVVMLKTGTYKIFNKYKEHLKLEVKIEGTHGFTCQPTTHVFNRFINGSGMSGAMYRRFTSAVVVTDKLAIGSGRAIKIRTV